MTETVEETSLSPAMASRSGRGGLPPVILLGGEANALSVSPSHRLRDLRRDFRRLFGRQLFFPHMVLLEKGAVIKEHNHLCLPLNYKRKIRMRNEQMLPDVQHRPA